MCGASHCRPVHLSQLIRQLPHRASFGADRSLIQLAPHAPAVEGQGGLAAGPRRRRLSGGHTVPHQQGLIRRLLQTAAVLSTASNVDRNSSGNGRPCLTPAAARSWAMRSPARSTRNSRSLRSKLPSIRASPSPACTLRLGIAHLGNSKIHSPRRRPSSDEPRGPVRGVHSNCEFKTEPGSWPTAHRSFGSGLSSTRLPPCAGLGGSKRGADLDCRARHTPDPARDHRVRKLAAAGSLRSGQPTGAIKCARRRT